MYAPVPPYALDAFRFRFPALAACAGRAPLGGDREMALATLEAARLAVALLPPVSLDRSSAGPRAERAKLWLTSLSMPQPARMAVLRAFDATGVGPRETAEALTELARTITGHVDAPSQQELVDLAAALAAPAGGANDGAP